MENGHTDQTKQKEQAKETRVTGSDNENLSMENDSTTVTVHAMPVLEDNEERNINANSCLGNMKTLTFFVSNNGEFALTKCNEADLTGIPRIVCCCCKDGKRVVVDRATQVEAEVNSANRTNDRPIQQSSCDFETAETSARDETKEGVEEDGSTQGTKTYTSESEKTRNAVDFISELECNIDDDEEEINTQDIAKQVLNDLRRYNIPQSVFAHRVLKRSQGTLSDNLRRPKPWKELRAGREIFKKMKLWLGIPEVQRIPDLRRAISMKGEIKEESKAPPLSLPIPLPDYCDFRPPKKPRHFFTETQKRTLFAIFRETPKPSKEMQEALAEQLQIDKSTVSNFFMNARRRYTVD